MIGAVIGGVIGLFLGIIGMSLFFLGRFTDYKYYKAIAELNKEEEKNLDEVKNMDSNDAVNAANALLKRRGSPDNN